MNVFVFVLFCSLILSIHANFNVTRQVPNTTVLVNTQQFTIEIQQPVNRPAFLSFIHIFNGTSNISICDIDVHNTTSNAIYNNYTLTFNLPQSIYNLSSEFCITFDAGVLFSNTTNSSAKTDPQFWHLKVVGIETTTDTTVLLPSTSMGTIFSGMTSSSVPRTNTSTIMMTTMASTYTSISQTVQNPTTTVINANTGESPPTRSAQLGMGLGITFISILIIGEIIYFKYCYSNDGRSGSYYT